MQQAEILDNLMGNSPYDFIMNKVWEQYKENTNTFYRMFTYHDFFCICQRLYNIYQEWDDLEVFYEGYNNAIREIQTDFGGVKGIPIFASKSINKIQMTVGYVQIELIFTSFKWLNLGVNVKIINFTTDLWNI